jgi:signal transduction histidine kinase
VFFAIQAVLVGGAVILRRESIRRLLDDELTSAAEAMVENILAAEAEWRSEDVHRLVPAQSGFLLYAVRDSEGRTLVDWNVPAGEGLPFSAWEVVPQGMVGAVFRSIGPERANALTGKSERLRLATIPFRYRGELYYLQAAVRDQALERLLGPFFDLVVIGVPLGVLAALTAAWIIGGRAVAPVQHLAHAARQVSPSRLDHRFRVHARDEEITSLEDELNSALARIEEGYRAQEQFISNVSHELKTPIAVLLTEAQVAKLGEPSLEKAYDFVDKAEQGMQRLGRLVESFLIIARSDLPRRPPADPVPVNDLLLECVQHCKPLADGKRVRLIPRLVSEEDGRPEAVLFGDGELLGAMLENLVRNAIDHAPPETPVSIEAVCEDEAVRITVRDKGRGIPDEYLDKVLGRFVQVPTDEGRDGSGLGLAIASSVAELHGGSVRAGNEPNGGCAFEVVLPLG